MHTLSADVDGLTVESTYEPAELPVHGYPLLVLLHGGGYTSEYFKVAGSQAGSFVDIANRSGFDVLRIDRPGYGRSTRLADEVNTYAHQAEILARAVASAIGDEDRPVFLVGHSIGGMISLELAARQLDWCLVGLSVSGMGAQLSDSGLGEQLGAIPGSGLAELPAELRRQIFYGPEATVSADVVEAAGICYAPAPIVELRAAARWAFERLDEVAAAVTAPVHHALGEYDSLWDVSEAALAAFTSRFRPEVSIRPELIRRAGHSIDHHRVGATLHHRQLGFAHRCAVT
ncbi:alpha/beta fold hydrolase [Mycobacterium sp. 21AC1]|uniref:alpha/beta hydrolase n=1 Tax=[Mycobacterium] appelbergii TaxID=2939269 RepID=UPI0029390425|nr:alpha/beta hydrolase [Mycobacterium sp. 21AC1]MDV3128994.1 alpha/beta fold hydrolase [Mycobacterium sp. 21AC1]